MFSRMHRQRGLKGKTVQIRRGPAAVTGDERRMMPLFRKMGWEGAASRVIREPEDLPMKI